jgi:hypothetical protein
LAVQSREQVDEPEAGGEFLAFLNVDDRRPPTDPRRDRQLDFGRTFVAKPDEDVERFLFRAGILAFTESTA